jgi:hypothetical protein
MCKSQMLYQSAQTLSGETSSRFAWRAELRVRGKIKKISNPAQWKASTIWLNNYPKRMNQIKG